MPTEAQQLNPVLVQYLKEARPEQRKYVFSKLDSGTTQDQMASAITQKYGAKYGGEVKPVMPTNKPFDTGSFYESLGDKNPLLPTAEKPQAAPEVSGPQTMNPQARQITPQESAMGAAGYGATTMGAEQARTQDMSAVGLVDSNVPGDLLVGAGKGALSTVKGASQLGEGVIKEVGQILTPKKYEAQLGFADEQPSTAENLQGMAEKGLGVEEGSLTTPTNTAQKIGFGAEQLAEFFLPGGAAAKATKALEATKLASGAGKLAKVAKFGAKVLPEAAITSGQMAMQEGSTDNLLQNVLLFGTLSTAGKALGKLSDVVTKKIPPRLYNTAVKPTLDESRKAIKYKGETLGEELIKRGISGSDDKLLAEATSKINAAEDSLQNTLINSTEVIRKEDIIPYFDDLIKSKKATPGMKEEAAKILEVVNDFPKFIPVSKANEMKRNLYTALRDVSFKLDPSLSTKKEAMKTMASAIKQQIEKQIGGDTVKSLNKELSVYGRLEDRIVDKLARENRNKILGLTDLGTGGIGATAGAVVGGPVGAAVGSIGSILAKNILGSTAGKTTIAVKLNRLGELLDKMPTDTAGKITKIELMKLIESLGD